MNTREPSPRRSTAHERRDGFTLVELLIVIVILGILATVTVFAVRGITDKGQENAEGTDLNSLSTAVEAYWLDNRTNPTEAELVSGGYLTEESTLHNLAVAGDGSFEITNVRTGNVVDNGQAAAAGGGGGGGGAPASATAGTPVVVGGVPMLRYGPAAANRPFYIVGAGLAGSQWDAAVNANAPIQGAYTFFFVDVANVTTVAEATAIRAAVEPNWGLVMSTPADVANLDGTANSMYWHIENVGGVVRNWVRIHPGPWADAFALFAIN